MRLGRTARAPWACRCRVIDAGAPADLVAIDLDRAEIAGIADEHLAAAIVMAGSAALRHPHLGRRPLAA